ncbi:antigen 332, putative [hydrothermal vent metagenome]|uniref:Antigen 332, putative n=1 Tax=hydrothermal vent metagenome TaxID=652676 RepID=A0A1W1BIA5_9ZZZZ
MYYGYNDNKELVIADREFIKLLGYNNFDELSKNNVINAIKLEKNKISIKQSNQTVNADFNHTEIESILGNFHLIELKDIYIKNGKEDGKSFKPSYKAIYLDVDKISKEIGLSVEDYKLYLDSFIDQSIIDEKRLLEGNDKVIKNLSNLALTLKIPHINILLLKIKKLSHRERMPLIDEYYSKLALITLEKPEDEDFEDLFLEDDLEEEKKEEVLNARFTDLLKSVPNETEKDREVKEEDFEDFLEEVHTPKVVKPKNNIKEIDLENIPALPISYNPQTAADELNLPVVLIEEFVDDFIEQARQDKDHLLTSYYQKDMDNIHELGHKLKGAASNLRINELADILEEIQFCTEHAKLEGLFIKFWGHFLSLEDYMRNINRI